MGSKGSPDPLSLVIGSSLSRRALLKGFGGAVGLAALGCGGNGSNGGGGPDGGGGSADGLFEVLDQVRQALRQSPDHLVQRADDLVAAKDAEGLFELVRDRIATYPTERDRMRNPDTYVRWGAKATLRGGAGTPREKADLLRDLYVRAGFTAEVVAGRVAEPPEDWLGWLLRPVDRPFAPAVDAAQLASWRDSLALPAATSIPEIDPSGADADALVDQLVPHVDPDSFFAFEFDARSDFLRLPVVRVEVDGEVRYANPSVPGAEFGTSYLLPQDEELAAPDATGLLDIEVALLTATSAAPGERIELVRRTYALDELLGRQLVVSMLPAVPLEAWPAISFDGVRAVVPTLAVQGNDAPLEELQALTVTGEPITVDGQTIAVDGDGTIRVGDTAIVDPSRTTPPVSEVDSLVIDSIDAAAFGEVALRARAFDAGGQPVEGLAADAFELYEEDEPVGFLVRANATQPRVTVLSDQSLSMPPEYRGEAGQDFVDQLAAEIQATEPRATFTFETSGSDLWTALAREAQKQPTLIIYLTDGDVVDELTPEIQATLEAGPPALLIAVEGSTTETLDQMAALTGGAVAPVSDPADAVAQAAAFIAAQDVAPYVLSYAAPADGPSQRAVRLATSTGVSATGSYAVPAQPAQPRRLSGLYLSVRIGGDEVTRTLAGNLHRTEAPVAAADLDDTRDALFGTIIASFEAGLPSPSQWLDDLVSSKLSLQPLYAATEAGDAEAAMSAFTGGVRHVPPELFTVHAPLPADPQQLLFETGIRTTIYSERPRLGTSKVLRKIDVLPTARPALVSRAGTEAERIEEAMRATARTAIAEQALFGTSTASLLDGVDLLATALNATSVFRNHPDLSADEEARWKALLSQSTGDVRIVPAGGTPLAYWSVDQRTGALLGILGDGSGGGSIEEDVARVIKAVDKLAAYFNLLATAAGTGVAIGLVVNHGQLLARLYGAVTITISLLDASGLDQAIREALLNFACNAMKTLFLGAMGQKGTEWGTMDNLLSLLTDSTAFSCPG